MDAEVTDGPARLGHRPRRLLLKAKNRSAGSYQDPR